MENQKSTIEPETSKDNMNLIQREDQVIEDAVYEAVCQMKEDDKKRASELKSIEEEDESWAKALSEGVKEAMKRKDQVLVDAAHRAICSDDEEE